MPEVTLRPAAEADARRLREWRNDPVTRRFSFTSQPVTADEHERWLRGKLADPGTRLWIAEVASKAVGQVRAERQPGGQAELHIAVAPEARGLGYAPAILCAASTSVARQLGVRRVVGRVMAANAASRRAFEKAGFTLADHAADPLRYGLDLLPAPVVAIVQARMGSTRLPGKVLANVGGRPLLAHMLDRVRCAASVDQVCVATTVNARDDGIAGVAGDLGIGIFRGSEEDVLGRFVGAARYAEAGTVVRLTGDCPLLTPDVIDAVVGALAGSGADLATNAPPAGRTYPDGMDVEVFTRAALERISAEAGTPAEREHVTLRFHSGGHRVEVVHLDPPRGNLRITVDTAADLALVGSVLERLLAEGAPLTLPEVLAVVDSTVRGEPAVT